MFWTAVALDIPSTVRIVEMITMQRWVRHSADLATSVGVFNAPPFDKG